jgi:hypothetical protein
MQTHLFNRQKHRSGKERVKNFVRNQRMSKMGKNILLYVYLKILLITMFCFLFWDGSLFKQSYMNFRVFFSLLHIRKIFTPSHKRK